MEEASRLIAEELENLSRVKVLDEIWPKREAIGGLSRFALWRERAGDHRMADALLAIARAPNIGTFVVGGSAFVALFEEASPNPPSRIVLLVSRDVHWGPWTKMIVVTRWVAAALETPYTEEAGQCVVDTLLQIVSVGRLQPHIPVDIWAWLKKRPSLPPVCHGRSVGTRGHVVRGVRELGDVEILESYFLLVWSEWEAIYWDGLIEMVTSIREDFCGIGMERHREVLIERLDHILGQLDRGLGHLRQQNPSLGEGHISTARKQYEKLNEVLQGVDGEALEILTRMPSRLVDLFNLLMLVDVYRISLDVHLCIPSPMSVAMHSQRLLLAPPTPHFNRVWVPQSL